MEATGPKLGFRVGFKASQPRLTAQHWFAAGVLAVTQSNMIRKPYHVPCILKMVT